VTPIFSPKGEKEGGNAAEKRKKKELARQVLENCPHMMLKKEEDRGSRSRRRHISRKKGE